jgi:hypothetical protein
MIKRVMALIMTQESQQSDFISSLPNKQAVNIQREENDPFDTFFTL